MALKFSLTKALVETIEPPATGRITISDARVRGLVLTVTAKGARSFYLYRKIDGRPVRTFLAKWPDLTVEQVRRKAEEFNTRLAKGEKINELKRATREELTLEKLFAVWLDGYAKLQKKTWQDDQRQFRTLLNSLHKKKLSELTVTEVSAWHKRIGEERGPYAANRGLALLSCIFSRARVLVGYVGTNPAHGVTRFRETKRDRFLQPNELPKFFAAIDEEPDPWPDYFRLALLTGARRANLMAMRWQDIDLATATWRIPAAAAKGGELIALPLVTEAVEILRRRQTTSGSETWVFPGDGKAGHLREIKSAWSRIVKRAGLADLRPHDLRRTLGSWQAGAGVSTTIIGRSLGHAAGSPATAVYARVNLDPVREAVEAATSAMMSAAKPKPR